MSNAYCVLSKLPSKIAQNDSTGITNSRVIVVFHHLYTQLCEVKNGWFIIIPVTTASIYALAFSTLPVSANLRAIRQLAVTVTTHAA